MYSFISASFPMSYSDAVELSNSKREYKLIRLTNEYWDAKALWKYGYNLRDVPTKVLNSEYRYRYAERDMKNATTVHVLVDVGNSVIWASLSFSTFGINEHLFAFLLSVDRSENAYEKYVFLHKLSSIYRK